MLAMLAASVALAPLSVMSFNVRFGTANDGEHSWPLRREAAISMLRAQRPAILGLQESLHFQNEEIQAALEGYASFGVGRDDGLRAGEHSKILWDNRRLEYITGGNFWLSETPEVVGSKGWGANITRLCTWVRLRDRASNETICVYNAHLDHQSQPSREGSVRLILQRVRERGNDDRVIVMGDFNAGEANPAIRLMLDAGFRDSFRVLYPNERQVGTYTGFEDIVDGEKIDYVFVDDRWDVLKAAILRQRFDGRPVSDHYPVTATLR
jgi:endonuclease/exonuclease/phosphatase family metal-dependent hydrolase